MMSDTGFPTVRRKHVSSVVRPCLGVPVESRIGTSFSSYSRSSTQGPSMTRWPSAEVASTAVLCGTAIEIAHGVVTAAAAALCGSLTAIQRFHSSAETLRVMCTSLRGSIR